MFSGHFQNVFGEPTERIDRRQFGPGGSSGGGSPLGVLQAEIQTEDGKAGLATEGGVILETEQ